MSKVNEKLANIIHQKMATNSLALENLALKRHREPTHVIDVYKMRQGKFKNVRIWIWLDLGTGEREDLFMSDADNNIITSLPTLPVLYEETLDPAWGKVWDV